MKVSVRLISRQEYESGTIDSGVLYLVQDSHGILPYMGTEKVSIDSLSPQLQEEVGSILDPKVAAGESSAVSAQAAQIAAEASLDAPEEYSREVYDEYVERRKCLIDGLNRIPGVYSPIPMGAFYTVAKLPVDDAEAFCAWCLSDFEYEGETVMMAPAAGFYTTPGAGKDQVRLAYVLKKEDLTRALFVLRKALEAYPGNTQRQG